MTSSVKSRWMIRMDSSTRLPRVAKSCCTACHSSDIQLDPMPKSTLPPVRRSAVVTARAVSERVAEAHVVDVGAEADRRGLGREKGDLHPDVPDREVSGDRWFTLVGMAGMPMQLDRDDQVLGEPHGLEPCRLRLLGQRHPVPRPHHHRHPKFHARSYHRAIDNVRGSSGGEDMVDDNAQGGPGGILDGIRIIDMSTGIAGPVATMLLAEVGADVVKSRGGRRPGVDRDRAGFRTWNRSKRSVALDLATEEGRAQLEQLLAAADVVVHELGPTAAEAAGLDDAGLAARHPNLIVSSVLSWPANHPDADRPVDETLAMARLGIFDEQLALAARPVRRSSASRSAAGARSTPLRAGIVARLISRGRTGRAGPAHTSLVQGALVPMGMHWSRAETPVARVGGRLSQRGPRHRRPRSSNAVTVSGSTSWGTR